MNPAKLFLSFCVLLFVFSRASIAATIPVDLNTFYADPTVTVSADGSSALMEEDYINYYYDVYLANDPALGDPGIVVPENVLSLEFHLDFSEGVGNDDTFRATLFDGVNGDPINNYIDDFYLGDLNVDGETFTGTVSWDLTNLDPSITLLGLEFQLTAWDWYLESTATISNLSFITEDVIEDNGPAPVPEPGTFLLLGAGLAGLAVYRRRQRK